MEGIWIEDDMVALRTENELLARTVAVLAKDIQKFQRKRTGYTQEAGEIVEWAKERALCPPFPKYARLGAPDGSALVHQGDGTYFRHAGLWELRARWKDGRLVCACDEGDCMAHANGEELFECTAEEWQEENEGYL